MTGTRAVAVALPEVERLLLSASWRFAKTMPEMPHWYTLRREWARDEEFAAAVLAIRQHGRRGAYRGNRYTYLYLDGMRYWTMGAPVEQTILINRAVVEGEDAAQLGLFKQRQERETER
jgi:hypothetical protein